MAEHLAELGPQLPRIFTSVALEANADPLEAAMLKARAGAPDATLIHGTEAGQVRLPNGRVWQPIKGDLVFSIIVRSELGRRQAAEVSLLLATALGQAISQQMVPLSLLQLRWPDVLLLNEGQVAQIWLQAAGDCDWLVVGAAVNLPARAEDAAITHASLAADGGADIDAEQLLIETSRLFLRLLNQWIDTDLKSCLSFWRSRLAAPPGVEDLRLADNGDLLLERESGEERCDLVMQTFAETHGGSASHATQ